MISCSFLHFTPPAADTVAFNGNIMHVVLIIKAGMKTLALITDPQFSLESSHRANVSHRSSFYFCFFKQRFCFECADLL